MSLGPQSKTRTRSTKSESEVLNRRQPPHQWHVHGGPPLTSDGPRQHASWCHKPNSLNQILNACLRNPNLWVDILVPRQSQPAAHVGALRLVNNIGTLLANVGCQIALHGQNQTVVAHHALCVIHATTQCLSELATRLQPLPRWHSW